MTDHQFRIELKIRAYTDQIDGYPLGHPSRENFVPIVTVADDRETTLDLPCYAGFTAEDRELLLRRD